MLYYIELYNFKEEKVATLNTGGLEILNEFLKNETEYTHTFSASLKYTKEKREEIYRAIKENFDLSGVDADEAAKKIVDEMEKSITHHLSPNELRTQKRITKHL